MIKGVVNSDLEAVVGLQVIGEKARKRRIEAIVDTGFTGHLTLPPSVIHSLKLFWLGREEAMLADGSVDNFDVYLATIVWEGQRRSVFVEAADTEPLLGMDLLAGHHVEMDVIEGGEIIISAP